MTATATEITTPGRDLDDGLTRFFDLVLPDEGFRCIATLDPVDGGRMRQRFVQTNELAARLVHHLDVDPLQLFFGCASFLTNTSRKGDNAAAARSFWIDLDCGPDKPYADARAALEALTAFQVEVGLPMPLLVSSGVGIHVYWPTTEDMTPGAWRITATMLKAATVKWGLHADPTRTADIASVLRPPSSTHRKGAPKVVRVLRWVEPVDQLDVRHPLANYLGLDAAADFNLPPRPAHITGGMNSDLTGGLEFPAAFADPIADQCKVMGMIRETRGLTDQPTWYHTLQLLNRCEDGEAKAHEWSTGDSRYSADEVDRILRRLGSTGPTSCAKFGEHQPALCAACPYFGKLTTPIHLGVAAPAPVAITTKAAGPRPLPRNLLPVEQCQLAFAPKPLQAIIKDIAEGTPTPMDYVLTAALTAAGAVLGNRVAVNFKRNGVWPERPNAWGMIVGDPSARKSPASSPFRAILAELERAKRSDYQVKSAAYQSAKLAHEQVVSGLKSIAVSAAKKAPGQIVTLPPMPIEPEQPTPVRYVTSDSSYEALGVLCRDNPTGMLVFQDELSGFLGEMAKPEKQAAKGFMLGAWSGCDSYTFDRIGRGSIVLDNYSATVFGGIQPALLERLMIGGARSGYGADGFSQRFGLMVWPDALPGAFIDVRYDLPGHLQAEQAFAALADLDPVVMGATDPWLTGRPSFDLDDNAYAEFKAWYEGWQLPIVNDPGELDAYRQHVAKLPKVIATIAILIHVLESHGPTISGDTMKRATSAARYFASHARRVYSAVSRSGYEPARALARRMSLGELSGSFTVRDAGRKGWNGMQTADDALRALEVLEDEGWVARLDRPAGVGGGRPTTRWTVAPAAKGAPWE